MPPIPKIPLRIGVVQFSPIIGQVQANLARAKELCQKIEPKSIDLLCFPEMAFTGYAFPNAKAIRPFLEPPKTGPTSLFCAELSKRIGCYVFAGYPEILSCSEDAPNAELPPDGETFPTPTVGANSAIIYDPQGECVGGYRKTNLFVTDKTWAKPGTGFATFSLTMPASMRTFTVSLGICMDLNAQPPADITAGEPYELADYCLEQESDILVLLNAWLDSGEGLDKESAAEDDQDVLYDWRVLNFWAWRLEPLWKGTEGGGDGVNMEKVSGKETMVVVCNRSGSDYDTKFAGCSALFSMRRNSGKPILLDMLKRNDEMVRIWQVLV